MYTCTHVRMHACMHACMHAGMHGCMDVSLYVCINVDMYLDMWVCILGVLLRMCGCVCVCVCLVHLVYGLCVTHAHASCVPRCSRR